MIETPGFGTVFEITENDFIVPEIINLHTKQKKYIAPSTSVLLRYTDTKLGIIVGRNVNSKVLQNVVAYAIKVRIPLQILRCELLSNLQEVDGMVVLVNQVLQQQTPTVEELQLDLEEENSNDANE
jgi:hypothetical protein